MTSIRFIRFFAAAGLVAVSVSCGSVAREGRGGSFIVIDLIQGIRGAQTPFPPAAVLNSDVLTNNSFFGDAGLATMHIVMKDAGSATATTPSGLNDITLSRYRVEYSRADGRNTPGVDVPYPFDGVVTATISTGQRDVGFDLVRLQAKLESPLVLLQPNSAPVVTTLATVTFYGKDQTGNDVKVTGNIQINFGNFGDPL